MNEQPEALRLADAMLNYWDERGPDAEAVAAELRRQHNRIVELEAALRQAVGAWGPVVTAAAKQAPGEQT